MYHTFNLSESAGYKEEGNKKMSQQDLESSVVLWVTSDLMTGDNINFSTYPGLKGYPLGVEIKQEVNGEMLTIVQTASSITPSKKIKTSSFLRPSDATNIKDAPDDIKQMLGIGAESGAEFEMFSSSKIYNTKKKTISSKNKEIVYSVIFL